MPIQKLPSFNKIYQIDGFDKEFSRLFGKSKKELEICKDSLLRYLYKLDNEDTPPTDEPFEKLQSTGYELYRIAVSRKPKNVRVLYLWHSEGKVILLSAFMETDWSDYREALKIAKLRIRKIEKGD